MQLFTYQTQLVTSIYNAAKEGLPWMLVTLPTGGGKTVIFSELVSRSSSKKAGFVSVFVHRIELAKQAYSTMRKFGINAALITRNGTEIADKDGNFKVVHTHVKAGFDCYICMVETVYARQKRGLQSYKRLLLDAKFYIIDEAHNTSFVKILNLIPREKIVLQFTATPLYATKKHKITNYYDKLIQGPSPQDLINIGRLVRPIYFDHETDETDFKIKNGEFTDESVIKSFDRQSILDSVILNYNTYQRNEKTICFCSSIEYARRVNDFMKNSGVNSRVIASDTASESERKEIFDWLKSTQNAFLINVGIATTGTDIPDLLNIILLRATTSLTLYIQIVGRGARTFQGKNHFKVFDYGNNKKRFGEWEKYRDWATLIEEAEKPKQKKQENLGLEVITVPNPFAKNEEGKKQGLVILKPENGQYPEQFSYLQNKPASQLTIEELEIIKTVKEYKPGWVIRQIYEKHGIEGLRSYARLKDYKPGWVNFVVKQYFKK